MGGRVETYKTFGLKLVGKQYSEEVEMASAFNWLRLHHPDYHAVTIHVRNEGVRHARQMQRIKTAGGFIKGASDLSIPGCPSMVCEMKTKSKTSRLTDEQKSYLEAAVKVGAFACVAYGAEGFVLAFQEWLALQPICK